MDRPDDGLPVRELSDAIAELRRMARSQEMIDGRLAVRKRSTDGSQSGNDRRMALSLSLSRAPRKGAARARLRSATSAWTTPRVTLAGHILCLSFSRAHVLCRASALPLVPHMAFGDVCRRSISLSPSRRPPRQARPSGSLPVFRGSGRGPGAGATTRHPRSFQNRVALAFQVLRQGHMV